MKLLEYFAIFSFPPVCVIFILSLVHCLMARCGKLDRIERWVATNAFSDIFKEEKKTCCVTERTHLKWLFKDIDLSKDKRLLLKLQAKFLILCNIMVSSVLITFWQFLVWEASYDCDEDDPTKDCFERKLSGKQDPLNCSSAAVQDLIQNETIQVICNRIVFNIGLATTVSYSSLKLLIIAVKVVTDAVLVIKKTNIWILCTVQGFFYNSASRYYHLVCMYFDIYPFSRNIFFRSLGYSPSDNSSRSHCNILLSVHSLEGRH